MDSYLTRDGARVIVAEGVSHSHRADLNSEVISKLTAGDLPFIRETVSLGRVIGKDHLVERREDDDLYFHSRNGNDYKTAFVLNREAEDTDKATVVIAKGGPEDGELEGKLILVTLFEGDPGMPEPYGRNDNDECRAFWETHALVPTEKERLAITEEMERNAEDQHVFDTENVRVFILDGKHPEDNFFSPYTGEEMPVIVSLDAETKRIRVSVSENRDMSVEGATSILWHVKGMEVSPDGKIALSPEGQEMGAEDLVHAAMLAEEYSASRAIHGKAFSMEKVRELEDIAGALKEAVGSAISERGLDVKGFDRDVSRSRQEEKGTGR